MKAKNFLRSFRVHNFKAIQDSRSVKLTPLTVFIGNNGSGKSSFVEAMETYKNIVTDDLDTAMQRWFGIEHIWNKRARRRSIFGGDFDTYENPIHFTMKGRAEWGAYRADMVITAKHGFNGIFIQEENFDLPDSTLHRSPEGLCKHIKPSLGQIDSIREIFESGHSATPCVLRDMVGGWQFLSLMPDPMGKPSPKKLASTGRLLLNRDGSNLAQYLLNIREKDAGAFEGIVETMQFVLDYAKNFEPIETQEIQRMMYVQMREADFEIPGWLISTGTLRILALLAVLRNPDPPPLIVVEEIENGLDPRTLHLVLKEIQTSVESGKSQVILTTHSPYFLNLLDLSHLVLCERVKSAPVFRRVSDIKSVAQWAKNFAPGQLYTMDRIHAEVR